MNTSRPGATLLLSRPSIALLSRSLTAVPLRYVAGIQYSVPLEVVHTLEPRSATRWAARRSGARVERPWVPSVSTSSRLPPPQTRRKRNLLRESGNLNHRFDAPGLGFQIGGELLDDAVEARPVGDPRVGVDLPLLDHRDDLLQLLPRGVPGAHDRQLAAVEVRVVEGDVELAEADEDQPPAVRDVLERPLHRLLVARAVAHCRGELLAADRLHLREDVLVGVDDVLDPEVLLAELQALPVDVGDHDLGARGLRELDCGQADRARAEDERPFAPLDARAVHAVRADAERFHERELLE